MNDKQVSTAARLAGIAESTVYLLENGSAALLSAGDVARIAGELSRQSSWQERGEAVALRYTMDGELAECPCCGSLDVGGAIDTVHCYVCGLSITKPRPLQNAADAWNRRPMRLVREKSKREAFEDACAALPEGVNWGDALTPEIALSIMLSAPTAAQSRIAELEAQLAEANALIEAHRIRPRGKSVVAAVLQLEQQLTESREREGRMREALDSLDALCVVLMPEYKGSRQRMMTQSALAAEKE